MRNLRGRSACWGLVDAEIVARRTSNGHARWRAGKDRYAASRATLPVPASSPLPRPGTSASAGCSANDRPAGAARDCRTPPAGRTMPQFGTLPRFVTPCAARSSVACSAQRPPCDTLFPPPTRPPCSSLTYSGSPRRQQIAAYRCAQRSDRPRHRTSADVVRINSPVATHPVTRRPIGPPRASHPDRGDDTAAAAAPCNVRPGRR